MGTSNTPQIFLSPWGHRYCWWGYDIKLHLLHCYAISLLHYYTYYAITPTVLQYYTYYTITLLHYYAITPMTIVHLLHYYTYYTITLITLLQLLHL